MQCTPSWAPILFKLVVILNSLYEVLATYHFMLGDLNWFLARLRLDFKIGMCFQIPPWFSLLFLCNILHHYYNPKNARVPSFLILEIPEFNAPSMEEFQPAANYLCFGVLSLKLKRKLFFPLKYHLNPILIIKLFISCHGLLIWHSLIFYVTCSCEVPWS